MANRTDVTKRKIANIPELVSIRKQLAEGGIVTVADMAQMDDVAFARKFSWQTALKALTWLKSVHLDFGMQAAIGTAHEPTLSPEGRATAAAELSRRRTRPRFPTTEAEIRELASRGGKAVHETGTAHEFGGSTPGPAAFVPIGDLEFAEVQTLLAAAQIFCKKRGLSPDDEQDSVYAALEQAASYFPASSRERQALDTLSHAAWLDLHTQDGERNYPFDAAEFASSIALFAELLVHRHMKE